MSLIESPHRAELKEAGWHSRGYLPHFDGRAIPQFITLRLFDSVPDAVLKRWMRELDVLNSEKDQIILQRRIEKYLDQSYGEAFLKIHRVAEMVQKDLRHYDGQSYRLWSLGCDAESRSFSLDALRRHRTVCHYAVVQVPYFAQG
jgi:putative transposase